MTKRKPLPTKERLDELFYYDEFTGRVTRLTTHGGRQCDNLNTLPKSKRYRQVKVDGTCYLIHRLIWVMMTGEDPGDKEIDHINNITNDNRWVNLRLVTRQENALNRSDTKRNGGILWDSPEGRRRRYQSMSPEDKELSLIHI